MTYTLLSATAFGRGLLTTGDLDPLYVALNAAKWDEPTRLRFCLAYWMFYHAGVAAHIAETGPETFWDGCQQAQTEKWPRGTERRHYKGKVSETSIRFLVSRYVFAEEAVRFVRGSSQPQSYHAIMLRAQQWNGFGPWISFKVADMCEAVLGASVDFTGAEADIFEDPTAGAVIITQKLDQTFTTVLQAKEIAKGLTPRAKVAVVTRAMRYLKQDLGVLPAPHARSRLIRLQELETILCKYKSHLNGHYPLGKDTREMAEALDGWGELAENLRKHLPEVPHGD